MQTICTSCHESKDCVFLDYSWLCESCTKILSECDVCHKLKKCRQYFGNMSFCIECKVKEDKAQEELSATADNRVQQVESRAFERLVKIDQSISIQQDIHNSKIASIHELKLAIDADETIENKHFTLAQTLESRFKHLCAALTELTDKQRDAQNEQRAIQTYYNELAKKLRADEREQIKLRDVQYRPPEKPVSKPKAITVKKNYDKNAVRAAAQASGLNEYIIQATCVQRDVTPLEAVRVIQETMKNMNVTATNQ